MRCILIFLLGFSFFLNLTGQSNLFIGSNSHIHIANVVVSIDGNIENRGKVTGNYKSILYLYGYNFQIIGDTLSDTFYLGSIYQNNLKGVFYNSNIYLTAADTGFLFINGNALIGDGDLWFLNNSIWKNNNNSNRFFVNKGRCLLYKLNSSQPILYPVAYDSFANAYAPIILEEFGVPDYYGVRVQNGIDFHYTFPWGSGDSTPILSSAVNNTWIINEQTAGGAKLLYTPIWQTSQELPIFYRPQSIVAWYSYIDRTWHWENDQNANGTNPYSARKIDTLNSTALGQLFYMPVGVGDPISPLPINEISIKGRWVNNLPELFGTYSALETIKYLYIFKSLNAKEFYLIDSIYISKNQGNILYSDKYFNLFDINRNSYYRISSNRDMQLLLSNTVYFYNANNLLEVQLYPNPANKILSLTFFANIEDQNASFNIYNLLGQELKKDSKIITMGNNLHTLDISSLPAGVYIMSFKINNQQINKTFIKSN